MGRLRMLLVLLGVSSALGVAAAFRNWLPNLFGGGGSVLKEPVFWLTGVGLLCAVIAGTLAFVWAWTLQPLALGSVVGLLFAFVGLATFLVALWWSTLLYFAVFLGPAEAFALLGLFVYFPRARAEADRRRMR